MTKPDHRRPNPVAPIRAINLHRQVTAVADAESVTQMNNIDAAICRRGPAQSELPDIDRILPPNSPRFLNTTLNMTETPGVTSPLRIPDWVTALINAMHSS